MANLLSDDPDLIDSIYECSVFPDLWPGVLDKLAGLAGARGGLVFCGDTLANLVWTASPSLRDDMGRFFSTPPLAQGTERVARLVGAKHAGFMREHDIYTDAELDRDVMYRDFLRPIGLGWGTGTAIDMPTGNRIIIALERERQRGPVQEDTVRWLDTLRPHIARSVFLSARLSLVRARAAADAMAAMGLAALVFDQAGRVLAANGLVDALTDQIRWRPDDRIALKDRTADALLQEALATLSVKTGPVRSFAIREVEGKPKLVAHLLPLTREARDFMARCAAILIFTSAAMTAAPPAELIQSLFDLTPAEARVARGIASGDTVADIAKSRAVSEDTVRTHVRNVFDKTGCRRQLEVAVLLSGIVPPGLESQSG